jgi:hypothetical protein
MAHCKRVGLHYKRFLLTRFNEIKSLAAENSAFFQKSPASWGSRVTPANIDERTEVGALTREVQAVTDNNVDVAFVDQGYDGPNAAEAAAANDVELVVVKLPEAKKGFVLLPRRWVVAGCTKLPARPLSGWTGSSVFNCGANFTPPHPN